MSTIHMPMEAQEIKSFLPQRYPMLMVDRLIEHDPGQRLTAIKNVSVNEPYFQGHFPNQPIMPGVLLIEAMAQTAGVLGFFTQGKSYTDGYMFLFAGTNKVRFKCKVIPGDRLEITAEHTVNKGGIFKFQCTTRVDGKIVATAEVTLAEQKMEIS